MKVAVGWVILGHSILIFYSDFSGFTQQIINRCFSPKLSLWMKQFVF